MKNQKKLIKYLNYIETPYILKVEDMVVEIEYSAVKKTFSECMINILKQRVKEVGKINGKEVKIFF